MPGYEGSLFDANGPMQFATQVHGIADALDDVNEKASTFFQTTQQGLDNLTQSLTNFSGASGKFPGSGGRGSSGWTVSSGVNNGGTGGQQGNTVGVGGSGNRPGDFETMTGGAPNGGFGGFSASRALEAGVGVATGMAQSYVNQTQSASVQQQLAAVQGALATGQSLSGAMRGIANNRMLATSQSDLAVGAATAQNLFGVTMTGPQGGHMGANQSVIAGSANLINLMAGGIGQAASEQALGSLSSTPAMMSQLAMTGMMFRQNGQYNTPESMVNALFQRYPQLQTMDDVSFQQSLSPGSPLYQDILNMTGNDPVMSETLIAMIRARKNSGKALPTNMTGGQAAALGLTSPAAVSQLQRQSSKSHALAQTAQGQDQALTEFNRAIQTFYSAVNSLFGSSPGVAGATGFGAQSLSTLGGPLGTLLGVGNDLTGGLLGGGGGGGGLAAAGGGMGGGGPGSILDLVGLFTVAKAGKGMLSKLLGGLVGRGAGAAGEAGLLDMSGVAGGLGLAGAAEGGGLLAGLGSVATAAAPFLGIAAAGGAAYFGTTRALDAIFGKPKNTKPSTHMAPGNTASGQLERNFAKFPTGRPPTGGIIPSDQRQPLIDLALQLAGVPVNSANENDVNIIATNESGWNSNSVNTTDSNAKAGHPSQGLMQTIPSTFQEYAISPYNSNIQDPLSNMIAGIKYAIARYGSLGAVPGVQAVESGKAYVGYDRGSYEIEKTKLALLHKGERVVRSGDNTISDRWGTPGPSSGGTHTHYHLAPGAVAVALASSDPVAAQQAGTAVAEALMERLAHA